MPPSTARSELKETDGRLPEFTPGTSTGVRASTALPERDISRHLPGTRATPPSGR
ncbi:hypothetical protein ACWDB3_16735 [Streptomyces bacillaris]